MKNIILEVPRNGVSVQLLVRDGAPSGQVVIVASDDVEIRLNDSAAGHPTPLKPAKSGKTTIRDLDTILQRLIKLKPSKRSSAVNSLKAMFHLTDPITDDTAERILEDLRKRGSIIITPTNRIQFPER